MQFALFQINSQFLINFFRSFILSNTSKNNTVFQYYLFNIIYDYILTLINSVANMTI